MKVIAYLLAYPPQRYIGSEMMTARLLESLAAAGHDVTVASEGCREPYARRGVRVVPRRVVSVSQTAHRDYDLFVSHPEVADHLYLRVKGTPYVGVVHNTRDLVNEGLQKRRPAHCIYNSEAMAASMDAVHGIPYTVIRPPLAEPPRAPLAEPPRQFVTAVNLTVDKGGEVFWRLAEQRPDVQFLAVLGGYGQQVVHEDRPNVWLTGQTPDMGLVWAQTRLLICPTAHESYGMAAVEAAASGVPVAITDLPGPREALADAAVYVPADDDGTGWLAAVDAGWGGGLSDLAAAGRVRGRVLAARTEADLRTWESVARSLARSM